MNGYTYITSLQSQGGSNWLESMEQSRAQLRRPEINTTHTHTYIHTYVRPIRSIRPRWPERPRLFARLPLSILTHTKSQAKPQGTRSICIAYSVLLRALVHIHKVCMCVLFFCFPPLSFFLFLCSFIWGKLHSSSFLLIIIIAIAMTSRAQEHGQLALAELTNWAVNA